jgi:stage II sporulation protein D
MIQTDNGSKLATGAGSFAIELSSTGLAVKPESGSLVNCKSSSVTISPDEPTSILTLKSPGIAERKYRGSIEMSVSENTLKVVNVVDVEDYLLGVLPAEMGESSPTEALRAQAITARTYTLGNHHKHAAQGFDVCDSTHCQTYGGVAAEKPKCSQAVLDTKGMVLTFGGEVAAVMYSTDCGGATVNYCEIRPGSNYPYLKGTVDPEDIARTTWEQTYALQDLADKLTSARISGVTELQAITVAKTGFSGRPLEVEIAGKSGKVTIATDKIRSALGLKSTLFTIEAADGKVTFKGKGWGHGIGLCQTGAKGLASAPHNFTCAQILSHYFPGTQITVGTVNADSYASERPSQRTNKEKPAETAKAVMKIFDVRLVAPDRL